MLFIDDRDFYVTYFKQRNELSALQVSKQYYEQHKTDYRVLEAQKKIRYLFIDQSKVGEKLTLPDDELKAEYDKLSPEAKRAGVKTQMIVLKVAKPELV